MHCLAKLAIIFGFIASGWVHDARGGELSFPIFDVLVAGPPTERAGQWRTKVQAVFDATTRSLTSRTYSVWDDAPARDRDFTWQPDDLAGDKAGPVKGSGRLVWRARSLPVYDPASVVAEHHGKLRNGRPEGHGIYIDKTGLKYEGRWRDGLMDGAGALQLPAGDEYVGLF